MPSCRSRRASGRVALSSGLDRQPWPGACLCGEGRRIGRDDLHVAAGAGEQGLGNPPLGADVRITGRSQDEAQIEVERLVAEEGLVMVPPFDNRAVVAGQGTLGQSRRRCRMCRPCLCRSPVAGWQQVSPRR